MASNKIGTRKMCFREAFFDTYSIVFYETKPSTLVCFEDHCKTKTTRNFVTKTKVKTDYKKILIMAALTELSRGCMAFQANSELNKIVFKPNNEKVNDIIVYFGGDVQNLKSEMLKSRTNAKYSEHSIEASIAKIAQSYKSSLVLAVLPIRLEMETFSCYDNFVKSNELGAPTNHSCSGDVQALSHLYNIITTSTTVIPP